MANAGSNSRVEESPGGTPQRWREDEMDVQHRIGDTFEKDKEAAFPNGFLATLHHLAKEGQHPLGALRSSARFKAKKRPLPTASWHPSHHLTKEG